MPIDPQFPKNQQVIGKHSHSDGQHFHFVWGPGRTAEAAKEEVKEAYEAREEQLAPLACTVQWSRSTGILALQTARA